jgi:hypothetical protein
MFAAKRPLGDFHRAKPPTKERVPSTRAKTLFRACRDRSATEYCCNHVTVRCFSAGHDEPGRFKPATAIDSARVPGKV